MSQLQSNLLKAFDKHQMKAKGVPDIEARVKQAVESESDSDTGAKGAVLGLNLN